MACCWPANLSCWWTQVGNCDDIWWYFREIRFQLKHPKSVWFRITAARYKVVLEEISLHWASFEPKQPHIMHSSAIDHGAKVTHSHRLTSIQWVFYPCVWEVEIKQPFLREEEGFIQKSCHVCLYFIYLLCSAIIFKTAIFFKRL